MSSRTPALGRAGRLRPLVLAGFGAAALTIVSLGVTAVLNLESVETDAAWVTHTYDVISGLADILAASVDSGAGARGFVNTGDPAQLALHERGADNAAKALERLHQLTLDDPGQRADLAGLEAALTARAELLNSLIEERRRDPEEARSDPKWTQITAFTERLRGLLDGLQQHQRVLLVERRERLARRALALLLVIGGGCGLLLAFVLATFAAALRHERERETLVSYQTELMGVVGHDLRSPLSAIMMSVSLLASDRDLPTPKRINLGGRALASARRVERIIRDLLDFTRDRVGEGISIEVGHMDLGELCEKVTAELRLEYPTANIVPVKEGNLQGEWDADRITQIVSNLVTNAIKYGREGTEIQVRAHDRSSEVLLEVSNHGDGIPPHLQPFLFEPFQAGRPPPSHSAQGRVGLGLHIVRTLAEAHGGQVGVQSANDETIFTVKLPRPGRAEGSPSN